MRATQQYKEVRATRWTANTLKDYGHKQNFEQVGKIISTKRWNKATQTSQSEQRFGYSKHMEITDTCIICKTTFLYSNYYSQITTY